MDLGQPEGSDSWGGQAMSDLRNASLFNHSEQTYGDSFNAHLLEQYKLYVQSAENVSARRLASNRYMLTLSAAILALYGLLYANFDLNWTALVLPVMGISVTVVWHAIIKSHADLNEIKFEIVHELEEHLPTSVYKHEWRLAEDGGGESYQEVSKIERLVPWLFVALHLFLTAWIVGENAGVVDLVK